MVVLDAEYRGVNLAFSSSKINPTTLMEFKEPNKSGTWYIVPDNTGTPISWNFKDPIPDSLTNEVLFNQWNNLASDKTADENNVLWINATNTIDNLPAIKHCRSIIIEHNGIKRMCALPNQYQAMIIYMLSDILDTLDPTANTNPTKKLGYTNSKGRFGTSYIWSSTKYGGTNTLVRAVHYSGAANTRYNQTSACWAVPILEID